MSELNFSSSSLNNRKLVDNSKNVCGQNVVSTHRGSMTMKIPHNGRPPEISKNVINSVPNASDSNISDGVKTKELDKSLFSPI